VASIDSNRTAVAERSDRVCAGGQGSNRIRCLVKGGRIQHRRTTRTLIACCYYHHNASSLLSLHSGPQCVNRTTFRRRTSPRVRRNIGRQGWIALGWRAAHWVRREKKFHALDISGRCAVALIHVATTDPLRPWRHADLIAHTIIADCRAYGMGPMPVVIARRLRVVTAGVASAAVNRVMPVVIVVGHCSVPAAIVALKRVMCPANAGISGSDQSPRPTNPRAQT
jgi:hypothetical protein